MAPKVSVVTCSYNRPVLLRAAIESMRVQTDGDWEHLIYDDYSTEPEVMRVLEWALLDPRVRVWRGQENLNRPSVLWNFMLDRAHGRYFTVLDDDNEKLPTFVEAMSRELDQDLSIDLVTCGWKVVRLDGSKLDDYFLNLSTSAERLEKLSTCDGGAMLYRRETFERTGYFSEAMRTNEDWDWLRRTVHLGRVKHLHEVHATYRSHDDSRMKQADELGNAVDMQRLKQRVLSTSFGVRICLPSYDRLTRSQRDVCGSISGALASIPWVSNAQDLALIVSPFQQNDSEIEAFIKGFPCALSLHMEDPYALAANLNHVKHLHSLTDTWVCTNDAAAVSYYRSIVGDRIIICPSLSADQSLPVISTERDINVLLCGYAYPSRKRFVTNLLSMLTDLNVTLVGDGWEDYARVGVTVMTTQDLDATYRLHARAKTVVCLHRIYGDCSDGPINPTTINRGFMEGYSGARVFVDRSRSLHSFDEGDVIWYNEPGDLAGALRVYLAQETNTAAEQFTVKCRKIYTYQARLARILNCIRSPRYLAEIP